MTIVEERPPASDPADLADLADHTDLAALAALADRGALPEPAPAAAPSLALAMASIRISRGNPTTEETAALAVLLTARLRRLQDARRSAPAPLVRKLPYRPRPQYRAPGAWSS
ncbi:acyl-CoA carboxylase epsilon subunit (plasmid) [Streptomyces sp. HUAS TT3]|uniref:acyl-CoA carboxylase epsilon subunit n=1 Tax=Streptomyces sp. HUAS TT3 TaxID=3447510 RepID=UPI003F6581F1